MKHKPITITLDSHQWEKILRVLINANESILAVLIARWLYGYSVNDALDYVKSLRGIAEISNTTLKG